MSRGSRPTAEFRREAVRPALTSGRSRRELAEDLGIGLSTLTRRLSHDRDRKEIADADGYVHAELKRLRREDALLKQERDIPKKAAAFFAAGAASSLGKVARPGQRAWRACRPYRGG
jgi:transposase